MAELLTDPHTVLGLSDAGAHASQLCDACFSTHLLGHWVREKATLGARGGGAHAHRREPAEVFGITDRGRLAVGPAGRRRRLRPAHRGREPSCAACTTCRPAPIAWSPTPSGIDAVIVNGTVDPARRARRGRSGRRAARAPAAQRQRESLRVLRTTPRAGYTLSETPAEREAADFANAVAAGLTLPEKSLPCRFLYDARGSRHFEAICELPEYYLTRAEHEILVARAGAIAAHFDEPATLAELGSGSARKTRLLIEAFLSRHAALRYVPIDISRSALAASARSLLARYPGLEVHAIASEYHEGVRLLRGLAPGPKLRRLARLERRQFRPQRSRGLPAPRAARAGSERPLAARRGPAQIARDAGSAPTTMRRGSPRASPATCSCASTASSAGASARIRSATARVGARTRARSRSTS